MATEVGARRDGTSGLTGGGDADLSVPDRALYALFARHADTPRHARDRKRYRGAALPVSFDVYLARSYGASWVAGTLAFGWTFLLLAALPAPLLAVVREAFTTAGIAGQVVGRPTIALVGAAVIAVVAKHATIRLAGAYLGWRVSARRTAIDRSLPGAARYLHALSSGSDGPRAMLKRVAETDAYGETAVSLRAALNTAALTGSLREGLGRVARDTPSRDALAPFLLKYREHANQGDDALSNYLRLESRMLSNRRERARDRNADFMDLVAELFVVLLVLPALMVVVMTVMSVLAPDLSAPLVTPLGTTTRRALVVYGSAGFVLVVGGAAALIVGSLRPADQRTGYPLPNDPLTVVKCAGGNPACAAVLLVPVGLAAAGLALRAGAHPVTVALCGYVAYALPVGVVARRRSRLDDAKDREISDFVHAVAGHVGLGRPLPEAVGRVADDVDLGPLDPDVADLAFNLTLTGRAGADLRTAALDRFVERVGTPLAAQTMGLVIGALDAGSDAEAVFETLQTEVGRLDHEKRALRSSMLVHVAVGWTTSLLVVGIVVAVNATVIDGFAQLSQVSSGGVVLDADAVRPGRDRFRFYVVTQATVLACGLFAGAAERGRYAMLLHSAALVTLCYVTFVAGGVL